jgi:hypothetical protein
MRNLSVRMPPSIPRAQAQSGSEPPRARPTLWVCRHAVGAVGCRHDAFFDCAHARVETRRIAPSNSLGPHFLSLSGCVFGGPRISYHIVFAFAPGWGLLLWVCFDTWACQWVTGGFAVVSSGPNLDSGRPALSFSRATEVGGEGPPRAT